MNDKELMNTIDKIQTELNDIKDALVAFVCFPTLEIAQKACDILNA